MPWGTICSTNCSQLLTLQKQSVDNFFYTLWKKSRLKSTFLPYRQKKTIPHSKWTLLKSCYFYLNSLRSIRKLVHDFKSSLLDVETTISYSKGNLKNTFSIGTSLIGAWRSGFWSAIPKFTELCLRALCGVHCAVCMSSNNYDPI